MNTPKVDLKRQYYGDAEVATLLRILVARLRNKLCAGDPLPPQIKPNGCRCRIWPCVAVHEWLNQIVSDERTIIDHGNPSKDGLQVCG
jgi:hypothetical protein